MQRFKSEHTTALLLGENMMKFVPRDVSLFVNLTVLHLNRNSLTNLPDAMSGLSKLVTLFAEQNLLKQIPGWIGGFAQLKTLNLESNQLAALPKEMGALRAVETLRLQKNPLPQHVARSVLNDHAACQAILGDIAVSFRFFLFVCFRCLTARGAGAHDSCAEARPGQRGAGGAQSGRGRPGTRHSGGRLPRSQAQARRQG
jgi:hypothetical protein